MAAPGAGMKQAENFTFFLARLIRNHTHHPGFSGVLGFGFVRLF
jgi:hypothetical protein